MKLITGLTLAVMLANGLMAQTSTDAPPALTPPPGAAAPVTPAPQPPAALPSAEMPVATPTNKPAAKPVKKKAAKKPAKKPATPAEVALPAAPLVPNEPAVARQNNVNVRGQARINSEILTRLKQGDTVTVLEEVTIKHPKTDEPAKWAKIALPAGAHAWVNSTFLDPGKAVKPAKLNVRSGPGENYGVIGLLHKGDTVQEVSTKGDWSEITPPAGAYAFVAAHLLAHKEAAPMPPPPPIIPTNAVVENGPQIAEPPTNNPTMMSNTPVGGTPATPVVGGTVPEPLPPPVEEPTTPRIVQREGIVRGTVSIQAPSYFQLESLDNGRVIDYLYSSSTNVVLQHWKGKTVLVTGEEGLDERWPNTPVITIQKIQVVE